MSPREVADVLVIGSGAAGNSRREATSGTWRLSLLLAAVGLYGVLSYLVSQRFTEIGIRMALGAQRSEVLRLVLVDALRPVVTGLLLGSAGAAAAGLLIKSILYGTRPVEPAVFAAMLGSLLLTATVASAIPALRACRIEPTQALRME